jgi:hypothetical protein
MTLVCSAQQPPIGCEAGPQNKTGKCVFESVCPHWLCSLSVDGHSSQCGCTPPVSHSTHNLVNMTTPGVISMPAVTIMSLTANFCNPCSLPCPVGCRPHPLYNTPPSLNKAQSWVWYWQCVPLLGVGPLCGYMAHRAHTECGCALLAPPSTSDHTHGHIAQSTGCSMTL